MAIRKTSFTAYNIMLTTKIINLDVCVYFTFNCRRYIGSSHSKVYIYKDCKTYEDEISFTSEPVCITVVPYAGKALVLLPWEESIQKDKLYSIQHHVDYKNNQPGRLCVFHI
jgi:hypothetical protein